MRDQFPWVYIFNMKEKIKGLFLITASNCVHKEQKSNSSGPFNSAEKSITVAGS